MTTKFINQYINEYGQVNVYELLEAIEEKVKFRFYRIASQMIDELYEIYTGTEYENINNDLFVLTFDEETKMFYLIDRIATKIRK